MFINCTEIFSVQRFWLIYIFKTNIISFINKGK